MSDIFPGCRITEESRGGRSEKAEEQGSRGEKPRHLRVGLQPRKRGSKGAIAHKGRGFEPYLFRKKIPLLLYKSR
ncbi:MAG: hypothetical protein V7L23_16800 [Nostoc sp.]|uniref:hypothetical protein n=1 Tax=Nostoc sp. TaxID=1180 RepID=UPI002FF0CD87